MNIYFFMNYFKFLPEIKISSIIYDLFYLVCLQDFINKYFIKNKMLIRNTVNYKYFNKKLESEALLKINSSSLF